METETEMKVVEINLKCPDCEMVMRSDGVASSAWFTGRDGILYKCSRW